jgi:hypothetical protein
MKYKYEYNNKKPNQLDMKKCNPQVIFVLGVICFMRLKTLVSNQPRCEHLSSWRIHDVVCMDSKVQQTIGIDLIEGVTY